MRSILLAVLVATVSTPVLAAGSFDGTWKIDVANVAPPSKPNDFLLQNGSYSCRSCTPPFTVAADGAPHAISGNPYVDHVAIKVADAHTVAETETKAGKTQWVYTMTVSADGQSMTTEMIDTSAVNGVPARGTFHQVRTTDAPAGAHAVSGIWRTTNYDGFSDSAIVFTLKTEEESLSFSQPTGQFYKATLGGPEVPYKGDPGITTVSAARSGADTVVETDMRDGKVVSINTMTTHDGKTMDLSFVDVLRGSTQKLTAIRQ